MNVGSTWQVTVNSATTSPGSEFNKPQKAGDVFLVLNVTVKNLTSQAQTISSLINFTLTDTTGQKYDGTIDTDAGASLDGNVNAGSPLRGSLAYEVPTNIKKFQLAFQADITSTGSTVWDISV